jgi:predicted dehydrogenase
MKKKVNVGIVGTGYGNYVLLESLNKLKYVNQKYIYGRNRSVIKKLNIYKKVNRAYNSLSAFLKNRDITLICLATIPIKQYQILKKIKISQYDYFFLEKPLANNIKNVKEIYKKFKKIKSRVAVDFIFLGLRSFFDFKKIIENEKILNVNIRWHFRAHHYKKNILSSWKKKEKFGGGIYFFYIIHVIAYINFFFGRVLRVKKKTEFLNNLSEVFCVNLDLLCSKNIKINLDFNSNSPKNIHQIEVITKKNIYKLEKKTKDHVKGFVFFKLNSHKKILKKKNYKKIYQSQDSRIEAVTNLLNSLLIKKKPISTILDAFNASNDLQKIIDIKS